MLGRILLAMVVGGLVQFAWGSLSHIALGIGQSSIHTIPEEDRVLAAMSASIQKPGFYLYPGIQTKGDAGEVKASEQRYEQAYKNGPHGILVYTPGTGQGLAFGPLMGREVGINLAGALVAAILLAMGGIASYLGRVAFTALLGLFASVAIDYSYWTWYGFPLDYTLYSTFDQVVGWGVAGLAIAAIVKPRRD